MIGIVVVSHSHALAQAAVALASEMVDEQARPKIATAAGLDETTFGTDAMAIVDAINEVDSEDGVLVLVDLGSAVLSADMALEFLDEDVASRVRITPAPLVEGLVAALVTASTSASLSECAAEAEAGLGAKQEHLTSTAVAEEEVEDSVTAPTDALTFTHTIANPHGLHARPAATLVSEMRGFKSEILISNATTGKGPVPVTSLNKVTALGLRRNDVMEVKIFGEDQQEAAQKISQLAAENFGENIETKPTPVNVEATPNASGDQIVIGKAHLISNSVDTTGYIPGSPDVEADRVRESFGALDKQLSDLAEKNPDQAEIFYAQQALLNDPTLIKKITNAVLGTSNAVDAINDRFGAVAKDFEALPDPYLQERAQDVRSLQRMLLAQLMAISSGNSDFLAESTISQLSQPVVLVIEELDATQASQLNPTTCLGVVTWRGGTTGHGSIIASSRGIPVLAGGDSCAEIASGDLVAFDPRNQQIWIRPTESELAAINEKANQRIAQAQRASELANLPATTSDGRTIKVEANVACEQDAATGFACGAEGAGLVRTEILFPGPAAPSVEEQSELFVRIASHLGNHKITVRTWDVGGDKPLPFLPQAAESNPFLGERGVRSMPRVVELFLDQLKAVLLANQQTPIRVMFPMVTEPEEVVWCLDQLKLAKQQLGIDSNIEVGIMVEVPAVALRIAEFEPLVDFVSIGTNDLTQYTTAADRTNQAVSKLAKANGPAVLELIRMTCSGMAGKPIGVCGDLASDLSMTETLVNLGVTELSVRPPLVALIKEAVRKI